MMASGAMSARGSSSPEPDYMELSLDEIREMLEDIARNANIVVPNTPFIPTGDDMADLHALAKLYAGSGIDIGIFGLLDNHSVESDASSATSRDMRASSSSSDSGYQTSVDIMLDPSITPSMSARCRALLANSSDYTLAQASDTELDPSDTDDGEELEPDPDSDPLEKDGDVDMAETHTEEPPLDAVLLPHPTAGWYPMTVERKMLQYQDFNGKDELMSTAFKNGWEVRLNAQRMRKYPLRTCYCQGCNYLLVGDRRTTERHCNTLGHTEVLEMLLGRKLKRFGTVCDKCGVVLRHDQIPVHANRHAGREEKARLALQRTTTRHKPQRWDGPSVIEYRYAARHNLHTLTPESDDAPSQRSSPYTSFRH